jgi:hypothetical protein
MDVDVDVDVDVQVRCPCQYPSQCRWRGKRKRRKIEDGTRLKRLEAKRIGINVRVILGPRRKH